MEPGTIIDVMGVDQALDERVAERIDPSFRS
jgi:hypothetical protein